MQDKLEDTLAKLVAIRSVSDDQEACRQVIEYVRDELEPLGLHITAEMDKPHPWLVATTQATKSPKILLAAHLDITPATEETQYEMRKDSARLYGRGVWDMKYAAAGYIEFLKAHKDQLAQFDVGVLFTTDEEIGGYQGAAEVLRQGWRADVVFIPDGSHSWYVEERAKGLYIAKICAPGKNSHGSRPWEGDNAVQKLIPVLHELQSLYPSEEKLGPTLSINMLSGGLAANQVPDEACAWADFRAFEQSEIEEYKTTLERLAAEYNLNITEVGAGAPLVLDKDHPLVRQYMQTLEAVGITPAYEKSYGGSDARWFAEYDIPCIVTNPHGGHAHGPDEWVNRQDLLTFYRILEHFIPQSAREESEEARQTQAAEV